MKGPSEGEQNDDLKYPQWQKPLQEVLIEVDKGKLRERVMVAECAIYNRLQVLSRNPDSHTERQAIKDALEILRVIKRESLGFPEWDKT
jgi:hypothetical protein